VRRRQEVLGEKAGITLIDDFAHHPTAVRVTCQGLRSRYPGRRLVAVFEPRTNTSRRSIFQQDYGEALLFADMVVLSEPRDVEAIPACDRFSSEKLAEGLRAAGKSAYSFENSDGIAQFLGDSLEPGDVVVIMSNGSFDGLGARVLGLMEERDHERSASLRSIG
jgi:UDP-N-acetylmuramate: L-alanyl-gamma-D-glutamyl-meso-diaminopimelate ligase